MKLDNRVLYEKAIKEFELNDKPKELKYKVDKFKKDGKGFSFVFQKSHKKILRYYNGNENLGFKKINMTTTNASKRARKWVTYARRVKGEVYYSCLSKNKLAILIPTMAITKRYNAQRRVVKTLTPCLKLIVL